MNNPNIRIMKILYCIENIMYANNPLKILNKI